ncbi:hypothetical protein HC891_00800 [Candidatus Gracilibacteria bacterium]|nr:hypothetical protein [Candidatus Gracilibacteria bacterium]
MSNPSRRRRQPVRLQQQVQPPKRPSTSAPAVTRPPVQPVDYSTDYAYARRDLVQITIIGGTLLAGMIGLSFVF